MSDMKNKGKNRFAETAILCYSRNSIYELHITNILCYINFHKFVLSKQFVNITNIMRYMSQIKVKIFVVLIKWSYNAYDLL